MSRTSGFAYRCLPLSIANGHGWMILNEAPFFACWDGTDSLEGIEITRGSNDDQRVLASSHFGFGVLTFSVACLFRTSPGYDLWVTGPINAIKDGIQPLSALVETDWSPTTFTMNWRFTREYTRIWFDAGEPYCMVFPVQRGTLEQVSPRVAPLHEDAPLADAFASWSHSRFEFNRNLKIPGSVEQKMKWQKHYLFGRFPDTNAPLGHRKKLKVKPFR